jgi:cytochrome c-type biogenesis protein CcmH/NrfG
MDVKLRDETIYLSLVNEGASLFSEGQCGAALGAFWKAFRLRPAAPIVLFNIARTMNELKDPRAEDFYAAAVTQGNVDAFYQLATLYIASGRKEAAVAFLQAYLEGNPASDSCTQWARDAIRRLYTGPQLVQSR